MDFSTFIRMTGANSLLSALTLIDKLLVKCPPGVDCGQTVQRGDLEDHLKFRTKRKLLVWGSLSGDDLLSIKKLGSIEGTWCVPPLSGARYRCTKAVLCMSSIAFEFLELTIVVSKVAAVSSLYAEVDFPDFEFYFDNLLVGDQYSVGRSPEGIRQWGTPRPIEDVYLKTHTLQQTMLIR
ncbi:hypothetical protein J6590_042739 [Homalodisca vitripennis]|nr:hypothetical protein J6590_042739 [Homalodisca vitripennis]